ncbi:MAG: helix-turn-helix transcriptional regulator [Crocinitomicaceae bacterium]
MRLKILSIFVAVFHVFISNAQQEKPIFLDLVDQFELISDIQNINQEYVKQIQNAEEREKIQIQFAYIKILIEKSYLQLAFSELYAIDLKEIEGDPYLIGAYNLVLARLDFKLGKPKKALLENAKAFAYFEQNQFFEEAKLAATNQAFFATLHDKENALSWFQKAFKLHSKNIDRRNEILLFSNYAFYFLVNGKVDSSKIYIEKAEEHFKKEKYNFLDDYRISILHATIAEQSGDIDTENKYLNQARELCIQYNMMENLRQVYNSLSFNYQSEGLPEKALKYSRKADSVGQQLPNKMLSEEMVRLDLERRIEEEEIRKNRVQEKLHYQQKTNKLILIIALSLFCGLILISVLWMKNRNQTKALIKQNINLTQCEKPKVDSKERKIDEDLISKLEDFILKKKEFRKSNLTLQTLAKKLGTNRTYLSESINSKYQRNFNTWINEIRISESRKLLMNPSFDHYSIEGIAQEVGYSSISVFNSAFKKETGITPSQFRKGSKNI